MVLMAGGPLLVIAVMIGLSARIVQNIVDIEDPKKALEIELTNIKKFLKPC